jgi:hypothetical protein
MILKAGDATLQFDSSTNTMTFSGSMRLANMKEYDQISHFLKEHIHASTQHATLDLKELQFLNSSGITTLSLFILNCKKASGPGLKVLGNNEISWQQKSLINFKKLWNEVDIVM